MVIVLSDLARFSLLNVNNSKCISNGCFNATMIQDRFTSWRFTSFRFTIEHTVGECRAWRSRSLKHYLSLGCSYAYIPSKDSLLMQATRYNQGPECPLAGIARFMWMCFCLVSMSALFIHLHRVTYVFACSSTYIHWLGVTSVCIDGVWRRAIITITDCSADCNISENVFPQIQSLLWPERFNRLLMFTSWTPVYPHKPTASTMTLSHSELHLTVTAHE